MAGNANNQDSRPDEGSRNGSPGIGTRAGNPRVLVAEDHPVSIDLLEHLLRSAGISPVVVVNGLDAVALVARESWDLVLMDVQMPGMDGMEATRRIRILPGGAHLPIVALTAAGDDEQRAACLDAGFSDFVAKPVKPSELLRLLARWLPGDAGPAATARPEDPAHGLRRRLAPVAHLDFDLGLAGVGGLPQVFQRMLERFVEVHQAGGTRSMDLLDRSDLAGVARWMHAFSGPATLLGMTDLAGFAGRIDRAARERAPAQAALGEALASFQADLDRMLAALRAALAASPDTP
jgi:CheY-like chemotaxis protein